MTFNAADQSEPVPWELLLGSLDHRIDGVDAIDRVFKQHPIHFSCRIQAPAKLANQIIMIAVDPKPDMADKSLFTLGVVSPRVPATIDTVSGLS